MPLSTQEPPGNGRPPVRCLRIRTEDPVQLLLGKTLRDVLQALDEFCLAGDIDVHPMFDLDEATSAASVPMFRPGQKLELTGDDQLTLSLDYGGDGLLDPPATFSVALAPLLARPATLLWRDIDDPPESDKDAVCEWRVSVGLPAV